MAVAAAHTTANSELDFIFKTKKEGGKKEGRGDYK
jgi:hypothetical protein